MEEFVGKLWHQWISQRARADYPEAAVGLGDIERLLGVLFRGLGGDPGLRLAGATEHRHGGHRRLLARLAGTDEKAARAQCDEVTLRLPAHIRCFPDRALNRELYLWLAALAAASRQIGAPGDELQFNQDATLYALRSWPGLEARYRRLVAAHLVQRPPLRSFPTAARAQEEAIRQALAAPGSIRTLPPAPTRHRPVPLWLSLPRSRAQATTPVRYVPSGEDQPSQGATREPGANEAAYAAERVEPQSGRGGPLIRFRAESVLSIGEFISVNRSEDDDPDRHPESAAQDLDQLAIAPEGRRTASRVRFDLDLPSSAEDDFVLRDGLLLPEWDYRRHLLRPDHVRLTEMSPREAVPAPLPAGLARAARRLQAQFSALTPGSRWVRARSEGSEMDLDAVVRAATDRASGQAPSDALYQALERRERDLACLVLADLSLSTDAWVGNQARIVDVIRDSLLLLGQALAATGDRFALCGFSSVRREHVRFLRLKDFSQSFGATERGRILAIRPGYYTRLGAAIRHSTNLLAHESARKSLLLILSDGKPNDLDLYEGRYGIEDTRMAVLAARQRGLLPFCVTIDREGPSYLPHLFGPGGYAVIRQTAELPRRLPQLYAQLTH